MTLEIICLEIWLRKIKLFKAIIAKLGWTEAITIITVIYYMITMSYLS